MKRATSVAAIFLLSLNLACHALKVTKLDAGKLQRPELERIVGITTKSGEEVSFDPPGAAIESDTLRAKVKQRPYSIPLRDVQRFWVQRKELDKTRTIGLSAAIVVGTIATVAAIIYATKQSCPFVYSWNGTQYVFDGEPYGGAITKGLERDDYSELEHLREQNGKYRLLLTNEVDETQHTNLVELRVVDHPRGTRVVSDEQGNLRAYSSLVNLSEAYEGNGTDLLAWLRETDARIWEPDAVPGADGSLRRELLLTFPKPAGAQHADLIANAATGLWGSYMVKKLVELHGRDSAGYLASLDNDPRAIRTIHNWGEQEGLFRLPVQIQEGKEWRIRGRLPSGGPLVAEDRAIPLDLSNAEGNMLRIRLRPPVGFWAFNSFKIAYDHSGDVTLRSIPPQKATTRTGRDVLSPIAATDGLYFSMPDESEPVELVFPTPPARTGFDRTVFLHCRGWYELHLRSIGPPDLTMIQRIMTTPGAAAQFAADRFADWRQGTVR